MAEQSAPGNLNSSLYQTMRRIRRFEETILAEFQRGIFSGTTHTYLGQEANAAAIFSACQPDDLVFSNHRCHGHFLAYGGSPRSLFAEIMGKASGVVQGRGGSQHIHWRNFYSNGILGSTLPVAVGAAMAEKRLGQSTLTLAFMGDGALGEGVVYEALNLASLWAAPVLFIVENNHIAQTTPITQAMAGTIAGRLNAFGIPVEELDTSDVLEILPCAAHQLDFIRREGKPAGLILNTERFGPHSKGDDTRSEPWIRQLREKRDPLVIHGARLPQGQRETLDRQVEAEIALAFRSALEEA